MKIAAFLLRLLFALVFVWSGVAKLKDPISFADSVRNFKIIGDPLAPAMALFIPCLELVCGIAVIIGGRFLSAALVILLGSIVLFTLAIVSAWIRGLDISCGCFGSDDSSLNYPIKVLQNTILFLLGLFAWFLERARARLNKLEQSP